MDLSIIIVNYKSKDFTENCIKSIYENTFNITYEIIVVDNNSYDGCIDMLKALFPKVVGYQNHENVGFSGANNIGINMSSGKYILLLNPDTLVYKRTLDKMVEYMDANPDVGIAGCRVENPDGTLQKACRRSVPTPKTAFFKLFGFSKLFPNSKLFSQYNFSYADENTELEVDAVSGSFLMVRSELAKAIGGLDEDYFMYAEDIDFCYSIKKRGWKVKYYPGARITHFKGESSKHLSVKATKAYYDSMTIFFDKHFSANNPFYIKIPVYFGIGLLKRLAVFGIYVKGRHKVGAKG